MLNFLANYVDLMVIDASVGRNLDRVEFSLLNSLQPWQKSSKSAILQICLFRMLNCYVLWITIMPYFRPVEEIGWHAPGTVTSYETVETVYPRPMPCAHSTPFPWRFFEIHGACTIPQKTPFLHDIGIEGGYPVLYEVTVPGAHHGFCTYSPQPPKSFHLSMVLVLWPSAENSSKPQPAHNKCLSWPKIASARSCPPKCFA